MELRPAVVVAAVHVGAALQQQPNDVEGARHAEEVVAVRATLPHKLRVLVEQLAQPLEISVLDRAIREHERRRRFLAARKCPHAACQLGPAREPVPLREVAARVRERRAVHGRDPGCASLVILEIRVERLLGDFVHELGPAGVALLACEHELRAREARRQVAEASDGCRLSRACGTGELFGLLAKLFEIHYDLLPCGPAVRCVGREEDRLVLPGRS